MLQAPLTIVHPLSVSADELPFGLIGEEALVIRQFFLAGEVLLCDIFFVGHAVNRNKPIVKW